MRGSLAKKLRRLAEQATHQPKGVMQLETNYKVKSVPSNINNRGTSVSKIVFNDPNSTRRFYQKAKSVLRNAEETALAKAKGLAMHRELSRVYTDEVEKDLSEGTSADAAIAASIDARYPGVEIGAAESDDSTVAPYETAVAEDDADSVLGRGLTTPEAPVPEVGESRA